jgi:hypothetical protein
VSGSSNSKNLKVNSSVTLDFLFIVFTKLGNFTFGNLTIRDIDVLREDIYMIEQIVPHIVIVTFDIVLCDGVIFI